MNTFTSRRLILMCSFFFTLIVGVRAYIVIDNFIHTLTNDCIGSFDMLVNGNAGPFDIEIEKDFTSLSQYEGSYDRGDKFHKYCSLDSFCEYILIDQNKPVVDLLFREDKKYWKMITTIGLGKSIHLNSINMNISMADIYRNAKNLANPQFMLDL